MVLIVPSVVVSVLLIAGIYALARSRHGVPGVCLLTCAFVVVFLCLATPALLLHALGSFLLAMICAGIGLGPKSVTAASAAAMVGGYSVILAMSWGELRERQRLRAEYPLESIVERLSYEGNQPQPPIAGVELASYVEQRLSKLESEHDRSYRSYMLESLHHKNRDDFVLARGFGPTRMMRPISYQVELPDAAPVRLPASPHTEPYYPATDDEPLAIAKPQPRQPVSPELPTLLGMHDSGLQDFLSAERIGYVRDRDHVAGFEPHRFLKEPRLPATEPAASQWQVVRLELISLLKHQPPAVYVSEYLPQMDQLRDAATRPLSRFEKDALQRLCMDEDLVISESQNMIRMVGSLRAGSNCLQCHSVQRGQLLGAFSYELAPERPTSAPKQDDQPPAPRA